MSPVLAWLSAAALANPPKGEVFANFNGETDASQGLLTVQPALLRSADASLVLRATTSALRHESTAADFSVGTLGASIGPGFTYTPGDLSLGMAVGVWARMDQTSAGGERASDLRVDASLTGQVYWRPAQRAQIYGLGSFDAASLYLWGAAGGTVPILPTRADRPVGLWVGAGATTCCTFQILCPPTAGPVVELPIRDLRTVLGARAAVPLSGDRGLAGTRVGLSAYWWY